MPVSTGMFATDDPDCPAIDFSIVFSDEDPDNAQEPTEAQLENVAIEEEAGVFRVRQFGRDPGTFTYWIQAVSVGDVYVNKPGELINICATIS